MNKSKNSHVHYFESVNISDCVKILRSWMDAQQFCEVSKTECAEVSTQFVCPFFIHGVASEN